MTRLSAEDFEQIHRANQSEVLRSSPELAVIVPAIIHIIHQSGHHRTGVIVEGNKILTAAHKMNYSDGMYLVADSGKNMTDNIDLKNISFHSSLDVVTIPLPREFNKIRPISIQTKRNFLQPHFLAGFPAIQRNYEWPFPSRQPALYELNMQLFLAEKHIQLEVRHPVFNVPHGASGGPVVNKSGEMVGLISNGVSRFADGNQFPIVNAIPMNQILPWLLEQK